MNKTVLVTFATIFGLVGAYVPVLWGDNNFLSGWSILTSTIGGIAGIFIGVMVSRRFF